MLRTLTQLGDRVTRHMNPADGEQLMEDLARLHSSSIIKFEGKKYICRGRTIFSHKYDETFLEVYDDGGAKIMFAPISEIDNRFPAVGYYNIETAKYNVAVMINRHTDRRSWRYGFHNEIASLSSPYLPENSDLMYRVTEKIPNPTPDISISDKGRLYMSATDDLHSFSDAFSSICDRKSVSVAISRDVAVASSPYTKEVGVFLTGSKVGTVKSNGDINITVDWAEETVMEVCNA